MGVPRSVCSLAACSYSVSDDCLRYNKAREIKASQDAYCAKVEEGRFEDIAQTPFPQDLQWEALVDVLRGRVKVQIHCYETVDLDDVVRVSLELVFAIAKSLNIVVLTSFQMSSNFLLLHSTMPTKPTLCQGYSSKHTVGGIPETRAILSSSRLAHLGHPPAVAMFATNARYKREAYRGSEFAPRILAEHGLKVVMKV